MGVGVKGGSYIDVHVEWSCDACRYLELLISVI